MLFFWGRGTAPPQTPLNTHPLGAFGARTTTIVSKKALATLSEV